MVAAEVLSALGSPARLGARTLLLPRYVFNNFTLLRTWPQNTYARHRYGPSFCWRFWLLFDIEDLERLENLLNSGSDDDVLKMRDAKLESFRLVALVGALLASVALQALSLPMVTSTDFIVRGAFAVCLMLSIFSTFFICIQQRELSVVGEAPALRAWLSNGIRYTNAHDALVYQSSLAALTLLESPYEYLGIAVSNFITGMAAYMAGAWIDRRELQTGDGMLKEMAVLAYFGVGTGFAMMMFPILLGTKDGESQAVGHALPGFKRFHGEVHATSSDDKGRKPRSLP
ncbi:hypothetical protein T440DRAFT_391149 [Plenodomus tracheiphilus IPT5]|uniref:Uncharacterized protein n=1 Tax=Plenodomus tracheiphilus IPT5 TaxID=1408161 RepID=A0A6A7BD77_9PLEO|nr:hypothetical protein T440DRAFT_391149 [Plenodomus tracheiphilus IPT5]